jgi:hypothetical protein
VKGILVKWLKAPEELKKLLEDAIQGIQCDKRPMFGYPAYFKNANLFAGLFQDQLFARLSPEQVKSLGASYSLANLEPMSGRPMREYFVLPVDLRVNVKKLHEVLMAAAEHTGRLPTKKPKPAKKVSASKKTSSKQG